ncbi:MAG: hypothetical protein RL012_436 [Bacteroidota bacterium]|jgi:hypothetical protein
MSEYKAQTASRGHTEDPFIDVHEGRVAEWLGRGLQNLPRWFESTRDLVYCNLSRLSTKKYLPGWRNW